MEFMINNYCSTKFSGLQIRKRVETCVATHPESEPYQIFFMFRNVPAMASVDSQEPTNNDDQILPNDKQRLP